MILYIYDIYLSKKNHLHDKDILLPLHTNYMKLIVLSLI